MSLIGLIIYHFDISECIERNIRYGYDVLLYILPNPKQVLAYGGHTAHEESGAEELSLEHVIVGGAHRLRHEQRHNQITGQRQESLLKITGIKI